MYNTGMFSSKLPTKLLIDRQNDCQLCGLILRSIPAEIGSKDYKGNIILALSPKYLIIDGECNLKREFRVLLRPRDCLRMRVSNPYN